MLYQIVLLNISGTQFGVSFNKKLLAGDTSIYNMRKLLPGHIPFAADFHPNI
jgi:hypothetical protein